MKYISIILFLMPILIFSACGGESEVNRNKESDDSLIIGDPIYAAETEDNLPDGWYKWGRGEDEYLIEKDSTFGRTGNSSATIEFLPNKDYRNTFGSLTQTCDAEPYLGKRVRLTCFVKPEDVKVFTGMWLRIDSPGGVRGFENMDDRPVKGTSDWVKCTIVMDVPNGSKTLNYGVRLDGKGKVWIDDFQLEVVGDTVSLTYPDAEEMIPVPSNLGFEN